MLSCYHGFVHTGIPEYAWPPTPDDLEAAGSVVCMQPVTKLLRPCAHGSSGKAPATAGEVPESGKPGPAGAWPSVCMSHSVLEVVRTFVDSHSQHLLVRRGEGAGQCACPVAISVISQSDVVR